MFRKALATLAAAAVLAGATIGLSSSDESAVAQTSSGNAPGLHAEDFGVSCADPRADQHDQLQAFLDALGSPDNREQVGWLPDCVIGKRGELVLRNGSQPTYLRGYGGQGDRGAPTVIDDLSDAGVDKYSLRVQRGQHATVSGISFAGSNDPPPWGGTSWQMRGLYLPTSVHLEDISVTGYFSGLGIDGDHMLIEQVESQENACGVEIVPNNPTQGDIWFRDLRASSNRKAGICVAKSSSFAGARFQGQTELSLTPYSILRYDDGGTKTTGNWMNGIDFDGPVGTEYVANGIVADHVGDGAGILDVRFNHGIINWGLFTTERRWPDHPPVAAWQNSGNISNVTFGESMPTSTGPQEGGTHLPALKAPALINVKFLGPLPDNIATRLVNGERYWDVPSNAQGRVVKGSYMGDRNGTGQVLIAPYKLIGAVARGELLCRQGDFPVVRCAGGRVAVAVAGHDATQGQIEHGFRSGIVVVKNTSATQIDPETPLSPDPGGGVKAGGFGEQVVGRAVQAIPPGGLALAELALP